MAEPSISTTPFIIIFLFILLSTTTPSYTKSNHTDFEALLAFKRSIHGDPNGALSSWNETTNLCGWNGVSCSRRHRNRVVSLSLRSQGLVGSLSSHIGNLSFLRTIILQNNSFHGPIPEEIGRLKRLQAIELSNNSLGGGIPRNLSKCININYLNLIDNKLTGAIVPEIGSLVNLQRLGLTGNMLSGKIPPFLGNLTNLIQLSLGECGLYGEIPEALAQLRRIEWLTLRHNNLSGLIPLSLYNLSSMEVLSVASNILHGAIPSEIGLTLPKLRVLDLGSNHFTGPLPPSLSNSSLIVSIRISYNNFTGEMIDLTRLSALELLVAPFNHLKGDIHTILSSLTNATRLQALSLDSNLFTGSLPDSIGNLSTHLFGLDISGNQLSGRVPSGIGDLVALTVLSAGGNNLEGSIPSSIARVHKLQEICLDANKLTGEMPLSFGNLTLLNVLVLSSNNLLGGIPQSLGNCSNLLSLDLSENNLNGSIPPEIMRLSSISIYIDLSHNFLTGPIPSEVGALRNLGALALSHNRLSGFVPSSLSSCVMLSWLHLGSNSLQGQIPESLRALRGLQYLDLSQNNISGKVPRFLVEFRLLYLNLSFNGLQGEVPTVGVFQNESAISLQGNHGLCGGSAFLNLPSCPLANSKKKLNLGKILIPTAGAICLALALCFCFCVFMYRRRTLQIVGMPGEIFVVPEFLRLSYADLLNATAGFSESNLLGAGRFGSVFKGTITNHDDDEEDKFLAVKVLHLDVRGAYQSLAAECNALRGIRHRNLVKILSVCDTTDFQGNDFKALVYEFMANGSLEDWLHRNSGEEEGSRILLSFIQRLDIAIDVAYAVDYLHCGTDSIVIHGDLKPINILLDQDMVAHVGDFGLAKIISSSSSSSERGSSSTTAIKGTILHPSRLTTNLFSLQLIYMYSYVVSTQGDAYSYGILRDFVCSALRGHVMEVVDPFLHEQLNQGGDNKFWDCIISILRIGVRCSMELPRDRMSMAEVVIFLKKIRTSVAPNQN